MRPSVGDESPDSAEQAALLMGGPLEERNVLHFFEQARGSDVAINVDALVDGDMGVPQLAATKASASEAAVEGDRLNSMLPEDIATSMVSTMIRGAREQAKARGLTSASVQLDALRPYFDVETSEVKQRLLWSFDPRQGKGCKLLLQYDLYCPLMMAFSLAALLLSGMKGARAASPEAEVHRQGATLLGSALGASFSFWLGGSALQYAVMYGLKVRVRMLPLTCVTGYALGGVCAPLLGKLILAPAPTAAFLLLLCVGGGASAATAGRTLASLAQDPKQAVAIGVLCAGLNILGTMYLEWMYF
mmetsp:Transcript_32111/g.70361  ORF Transcript_32111/g.70361 Transcript_32111/m.70361 type:complete len:303 (+) Transcript_32111:361-1269(+)